MTTEGYDLLSENSESTVVARYERPQLLEEGGYQSESQLEDSLIAQLQAQGYEYACISEIVARQAKLRSEIDAIIQDLEA